jgi:signal transduction histidine kinase
MRDDAAGRIAGFVQRHGDESLAICVTAIVLLGVAVTDVPDSIRLADIGLAFVAGVAAARRSQHPLPLLALMLAVSVASALVPSFRAATINGFAFFVVLAVYSGAGHTKGRETMVAGVMTVGLYVTDLIGLDPAGINLDSAAFYGMLYGLPWATGRAMLRRRASDRRVVEEKAHAAAAIAEERARIARELHDVVAHSISVMVLQARGGRHVLESEPDDARSAFVVIEEAGQQALTEMRRLLGMLRSPDEELALAPQPSLRELERLVEHVEGAGLPVQVIVEGEPRDLPPGVDLSAFRIVQEALTNALKHAGPARARVVVRYGADELELEITDDGPGAVESTGSGYGLIGMRERVSVYGGDLHAGQQPGGGYALRVRLPLEPART